jgi:branched-chain amino acid transport system permease protein
VLALGLLALAAFPFFGSEFYQQMVTRMMILAIFAMSLDLLQGVTGLVSLGHAAFFGLGGYALALACLRQRAGQPVVDACPPAVAGGGAGGAGHRLLRGAHAWHLLHHGDDGVRADAVLPGVRQQGDQAVRRRRAEAGRLGRRVHQLQARRRLRSTWRTSAPSTTSCWPACWSCTPFCAACCGAPSAARWPASASTSTACARWAIGSFGYKLTAFTLAGALAGLAGYLWGAQTGFVNPELMGFHMSAHAIMMVILGGMGNFAGAIVGAFAFEFMLELFKDLPAVGDFRIGKHWQLWMGLFIVGGDGVRAARPAGPAESPGRAQGKRS